MIPHGQARQKLKIENKVILYDTYQPESSSEVPWLLHCLTFRRYFLTIPALESTNAPDKQRPNGVISMLRCVPAQHFMTNLPCDSVSLDSQQSTHHRHAYLEAKRHRVAGGPTASCQLKD